MISTEQLLLARDGIQIVENRIPEDLRSRLGECFPEGRSNVRNALELPPIRKLSSSPAIRDLVTPVLGDRCFAVRAILFNKTASSNWKVAWHQDVVISVKVRAEVEGFGPWSVKAGVPHVRPPARILENILAVRVHVDTCGDDNGPLRVLSGTHTRGILSDSEIATLPKDGEAVCSVAAGDVILMRPLSVHASSVARHSNSRRVIHIEFATGELPPPLEWHEAVGE